VFTAQDAKGGPEDYNGAQLDVITVRLPLERPEFIDEYGHVLHDAIVLQDNADGLGEKLIKEAVELYAAGKKLTPEKLSNRKNYMARTLDRMEGAVGKPDLFYLYGGYFYEKALQYWFELKGHFSKPAYKAVEDIKAADPAYYDLLVVMSSETSPNNAKLEAARKINTILFLQ
jgi:hypothetical protein